jgi:hypothetical protein
MDARTTRAYLTLRTHPNTTGDHKPRPSHNVTTPNIRVFRLNVCDQMCWSWFDAA